MSFTESNCGTGSEDGGNCSGLESSMEDLEVSSQASSGIVVGGSLHGSSVTPVPSESDVVTSKTSPSSGPGGTQSEMSASAPSRVSPLRGNSTAEEIVHQTIAVRDGLTSLRDDHYNILARIRDDYENSRNARHKGDGEDAFEEGDSGGFCSDVVLQDRITNVTASLEKLEVGIEESAVILALSHHFNRLEADRSTLRLEMGRMVDENDWLRDELGDTQRRLIDAEAELAELREEKKQRDFMDELKSLNETSLSNVRPITPSKIPVGRYRVEQEKDINRAMAGGGSDSNRTSRSTSPAPSRLPVGNWRTKVVAYKKVMEKQESAAAAAKQAAKQAMAGPNNTRNGYNNRKSSGIPSYFKINSSQQTPLKTSHIPMSASLSRSGSISHGTPPSLPPTGLAHPAGSRIASR